MKTYIVTGGAGFIGSNFILYMLKKYNEIRIINLDKLTMVVDTDGTMTPREAFEEAAAILVSQYSALAGSTTVAGAPALGAVDSESESELDTSIEELDLSARTTNALINNEIRTIRDLVTLGEQELRELKGFGSKALDEVKDKMAELEF